MSFHLDQETICALSTAQGHGAIAVVRICGPRALEISRQIATFLPVQKIESHRIYFGSLVDSEGEIFDEALVAYFAKGRSYTSDETLEFSVHGSSSVVEILLGLMVRAGAKPAGRGEFTYRAFMNGKIDLVQAESILSLIQSQSQQLTKLSVRQLQGELSDSLNHLESDLTWCLAHIEASIDFSQEGLETVSANDLLLRLAQIEREIEGRVAGYRRGRVIKEGFRVVLVGRPNVGKSSLLNLLAQEERALVTAVAGTTRDLVETNLSLAGFRVSLVDTAGLHESSDLVEKLGIERARRAIDEADLVLLVSDQNFSKSDLDLVESVPPDRLVVLLNKSDLYEKSANFVTEATKILQGRFEGAKERVLFVSSFDRTNAREKIEAVLGELIAKSNISDESILIQTRHFEKLGSALEALHEGSKLVRDGVSPELAAFELKTALLCLQEVLGKHFDDQILDRVFKEFCIGK